MPKPATTKPKPQTFPCTCFCGCGGQVYRRRDRCSSCRKGCFDCGCTRQGRRCDHEGTLYARLEAAMNRLKALGYETHPDCLGAAPPAMAQDLTQARREYAAHFGGGQIVMEG